MAGATHPNAAMKTTRSRKAPKPDRLTAFDQALNCVQNITTLAELLEACEPDHLQPQSINGTGILIAEQLHRLRGELHKLR